MMMIPSRRHRKRNGATQACFRRWASQCPLNSFPRVLEPLLFLLLLLLHHLLPRRILHWFPSLVPKQGGPSLRLSNVAPSGLQNFQHLQLHSSCRSFHKCAIVNPFGWFGAVWKSKSLSFGWHKLDDGGAAWQRLVWQTDVLKVWRQVSPSSWLTNCICLNQQETLFVKIPISLKSWWTMGGASWSNLIKNGTLTNVSSYDGSFGLVQATGKLSLLHAIHLRAAVSARECFHVLGIFMYNNSDSSEVLLKGLNGIQIGILSASIV